MTTTKRKKGKKKIFKMPTGVYIRTEKHRLAMSLSSKGKPNYYLRGRTLKKEHKEKTIKNLSFNFTKGKSIEEVYGKEKAELWSKHKSDSIKGEKNYMFGKKLSEECKQKISNSLKGKIPKNLKDINKNKKGKGNPMYGRTGKLSPLWKGGTSFEPYSQEFNKNFKEILKKRDDYKCQVCGKISNSLAIHHVNYDKSLTIIQNCISLCNPCHLRTNWNRDSWIIYFQSLLSKKFNYNYSSEKQIILDIKKII